MSEAKPYRVEVVINAPRAEAWRALTEPERVRRWFGWDYEGLDDEIRLIFADGARPVPPGLIELDGGQRIELESDGSRVTVRAIMPGPLGDADWDDIYDGVEEGWRAFFEQLRFVLETRPEGDRRTVYLAGTAPAADAVALAERLAPGRVWHDSRYQRMLVSGGHLVVVHATAPLAAPAPVPLSVTVSTYGLDDLAVKALAAEWAGHWTAVAPDGTVTTSAGAI